MIHYNLLSLRLLSNLLRSYLINLLIVGKVGNKTSTRKNNLEYHRINHNMGYNNHSTNPEYPVDSFLSKKKRNHKKRISLLNFLPLLILEEKNHQGMTRKAPHKSKDTNPQSKTNQFHFTMVVICKNQSLNRNSKTMSHRDQTRINFWDLNVHINQYLRQDVMIIEVESSINQPIRSFLLFPYELGDPRKQNRIHSESQYRPCSLVCSSAHSHPPNCLSPCQRLIVNFRFLLLQVSYP